MNFKKPHCSNGKNNDGSSEIPPDHAHPIDVQIGRKIRALRRAGNMSQTVLGDKIGVTFQQVQKYEKGRTRVGSRLHAIAAALEIDIKLLISDLPQTGVGERNLQALERAAFAASPEGVCLLDAFRILSPHSRRMTLGMVTVLAKCVRGRLERRKSVDRVS